MHPHVYRELRPLVKTGSTLATSKRLLVAVFGMGTHMIPYVAFEGFSTDITFVQPFVLVKGQNMPFESIRPGVGLVA